MSVGFGFSVGDFIAAIELVGTVIDALRSNGEAGDEYRELVSQLLSLETALIQVKNLEFEESQYAEVVALRQAAAQCKRTIDEFWNKARQYQPGLGNNGEQRKLGLRDRWMRIKWAVCKKEDVTRFKADLMGHTQSILLLLATVQRSTANIHEHRQETRYKTLAARFQEAYFGCMQRLAAVYNQGTELLASTAQILRINVKVFQIVLQIQDFITRIPDQVERQQPVYLIDALGKYSPFHLEFVRSAEALVSVLRVNFRKHGNATKKIDRGEFAIQDSATTRDIDLGRDWETCFHPGQKVNMSMVFYRRQDSVTADDRSKCPNCDAFTEAGAQTFVKCAVCGIEFQRQERQRPFPTSDSPNSESSRTDADFSSSVVSAHSLTRNPERYSPQRYKFQELYPDEDDVGMFQRVRIYDDILSLKSPPPWQLQPPLNLSTEPFEYGYDLPCEYRSEGCNSRFHPEDFEAWISHTLSHFKQEPPLLLMMCTFCTQEFECSYFSPPNKQWQDRMLHIGAHFYENRKGGSVGANHPDPGCSPILDLASEDDLNEPTSTAFADPTNLSSASSYISHNSRSGTPVSSIGSSYNEEANEDYDKWRQQYETGHTVPELVHFGVKNQRTFSGTRMLPYEIERENRDITQNMPSKKVKLGGNIFSRFLSKEKERQFA